MSIGSGKTVKILATLSLIGYGFGQQPKAPAPTKQAPAHWTVTSKKNEMDGIVTTTLVADSSNFSGAGGLAVRCGGNKAEVYVALGDYVQPELHNHSVRIKFDAEEPIPEGWNASTDSKGLFSYYSLPLLHRLLTAKKFLFEFTPFEDSKRVLSFDLTGLPRALTPAILKSCGEMSPDDPDPYKATASQN
jgi:hypothetical protein